MKNKALGNSAKFHVQCACMNCVLLNALRPRAPRVLACAVHVGPGYWLVRCSAWRVDRLQQK